MDFSAKFSPSFLDSGIAHSLTTFTDRRKRSTTGLIFVSNTFCCAENSDAQSLLACV